MAHRGTYPTVLRCDNEIELTYGAVSDCASATSSQVGLHFIPRDEPWRNGYNHRRHSSLGYHPRPATLPPVPTDERLSFALDQFTGSGQPCSGIEGRIRK